MLSVYTDKFTCKVQAMIVDGQWKVGHKLVFLIVNLIDVAILLCLVMCLSLIILSHWFHLVIACYGMFLLIMQ